MNGQLTKVDINKKAMIEALTQSLGIVTSACKAVGISRTLHYNWYNEDAEYKKAVDENTVRYQKHEREHNLEEWISKYVSLCRGMLRAQSKTESARARLVKTVCTTVCEEKLKKKLLENMILESLPKETPSSIDPQPVTP